MADTRPNTPGSAGHAPNRLGTVTGSIFGSPATWPHARSSALRLRLTTDVPLSDHFLGDVGNLDPTPRELGEDHGQAGEISKVRDNQPDHP